MFLHRRGWFNWRGALGICAACWVTKDSLAQSAPAIYSEPVSREIATNGSTTFTVGASGDPAVSYRWYWSDWTEYDDSSGAPWSGWNTNTLHVQGAQLADSGSIWVVVSNSEGTVVSQVVALGVKDPPSILTQPTGVTVVAGQNTSLGVTASGGGPLSYQWWKDGNLLSGRTQATLPFNSTGASDSGDYHVVITNSVGSVASSVATLTVVTAPTIYSHPYPSNLKIAIGGNASFNVIADAPSPKALSYRWQWAPFGLTPANFGDGDGWSGTATSTVSGTNIDADGAGLYRVVVTNTINNVSVSTVSNAAALTVLAPVAITTQPASVTVAAGQSPFFSVGVSGGGTIAYQWYKDGNELDGKTASSLTFSNVTSVGDGGSYYVKIYNDVSNVTSNTVTLTVVSAPIIYSDPYPSNWKIAIGGNASFNVITDAPTPKSLTYQWQWAPFGFTPANFGDGDGWSGTTTPTVSGTNIDAHGAGLYRLVVTNTVNNVSVSTVSRTAALTVLGPVAITTHPASTTVAAGQSPAFSVGVSGGGTITYQWYKDGNELDGKTGSSLNLSSVTSAGDGGSYYVKVYNDVSNATSNAATLTVVTPPTIVSGPSPTDPTIESGQDITFTVSADAPAPKSLTYQWQWAPAGHTPVDFGDGNGWSGTGTSTLVGTNIDVSGAGIYRVVVTNTINGVLASTVSGNTTLTVNRPPEAPHITSQPVSITRPLGSTATFTVEASGVPEPYFIWKKRTSPTGDATTITGQSSATLTLENITFADSAYYFAIAKNGYGESASNNAQLTLGIDPTTDPSGTYVRIKNINYLQSMGPVVEHYILPIRVGPTVVVQGVNGTTGADLAIVSPQSIRLEAGFHAQQGSRVDIFIYDVSSSGTDVNIGTNRAPNWTRVLGPTAVQLNDTVYFVFQGGDPDNNLRYLRARWVKPDLTLGGDSDYINMGSDLPQQQREIPITFNQAGWWSLRTEAKDALDLERREVAREALTVYVASGVGEESTVIVVHRPPQ